MAKVLVTGGSGFIGKHIIHELLTQGHEVRTSVRSGKRQDQIEVLFPNAQIEFVTLDLLKDDGWGAALQGIEVLIHTASPFPAEVPKDPQDLIRPAVEGTKRALHAAKAAGVTRVILTSSCAAIYKDPSKPPMAESTEANWTDPDAKFVSPYEASKTLAERAAWDFVAANPEMELTTICPGGVFGPPMDHHYGTSLHQIEMFVNGKVPMCPDINLPAVDVRDVAKMHVWPIDNRATIGERFAASAGAMTMIGAAKLFHQAFPSRKIPVRSAPNWLVKAMAPFNGLMKQIAMNLNRNSAVDGSKAQRVMEFNYIPVDDALLASASYIVDRTNQTAAAPSPNRTVTDGS